MSLPDSGIELVTLNTGCRFTIGGSLAQASDGRLLLLTCGPEPFTKDAFGIYRLELRESFDVGRSWSTPRILHHGERSAIFLPGSLLQLQSGKWLLVLARYGGYDSLTHDPEKSLLELVTQVSVDEGTSWSQPRRIETGWRYASVPLLFTQLASGRILYPSGYLTGRNGSSVACCLYSDDEGDHWHPSPDILDTGGEGFESGPSEPTVLELPDGRIWMLMRTQSGCQWESFSEDEGIRWSAPRPSRFPSSSAPAVWLKLRDGRICLIWNNATFAPYARTSLAIAVSDDAGYTFHGYREIAHTPAYVASADQRYGVQYPYPYEANDGTILVPFNVGDWQQMHLEIARIDPGWLSARSCIDAFSEGIGGWCGLGAKGMSLTVMGDAPGHADPCSTDSSLALIDCWQSHPSPSLHIDWVAPGPCGLTRNHPLVAQGMISCDITVYGPCCLLWHRSFLEPGIIDDACLRIRFDAEGQAFISAGTPVRRSTGEAKWTPAYTYDAYVPVHESPYPVMLPFAKQFIVEIRIDNAASTAQVVIDHGPVLKVNLAAAPGFCYFGIAAMEHGAIRLHRLSCLDTVLHCKAADWTSHE